MTRALLAAFALLLLTTGAAPVHAQPDPLTLSLVRAVRLSDSAITLSFKTSEPATGKIVYADGHGGKYTLTDSEPQTDHLFTLDDLEESHGYSFALSAATDSLQSHTYNVLVSPDSIGVPGTSIMPRVEERDDAGTLVSRVLGASTTPAVAEPIVPWWIFAILFLLFVGGSMGYRRYERRHVQPPSF